MDAKKLAGLSMAAGLTALVIMIASPTLLALIEIALVGALYIVRSRRQYQKAHRPQQQLQLRSPRRYDAAAELTQGPAHYLR